MQKIITHICVAAALAAGPATVVAQTSDAGQDGVTIMGSVVAPDNAAGIWSYSETEWNPTRIAMSLTANGGGLAAGDYYYSNMYGEALGQFLITTSNYDMTDNWTQYDSYTGKPEYIATTMAYSPWRNTAYGCFNNAAMDGYVFAQWKYDYFQLGTVVCQLERPWSACAFDSKSDLYAIERNGDLYKVNLSTGEMTLVGNTGVVSTGVSDGTIDTKTDKFYWCVNSENEHALYSVDLTTAAATKLYDLINNEEICGMFIPEEPISDDAPAKIYSVSTSFSNVNMTGKLNFQLPSRTKGGTAIPADQTLTYKIYANGKLIATGEGTPSARVQPEITMDTPGLYCFTVTAVNEAGESPRCQTSKFVGPDTPKAPSSFNATIDGNTVKLQWYRTSSGANGGNINSSAVTYKVVRYPDGKVVADNVGSSVTTVTDELEVPEVRTEYYYVLTASADGLVSAPLKSPVIALGPIAPPAECTFTTSVSGAGWTVIDVNTDNQKWNVYARDTVFRVSASKGFDDWAITPAVILEGGKSYPFTIRMSTSNYADETFEVKMGTSPNVESMTTTIIAPETFRSYNGTTFTGDLLSDVTGKVYIGIHAASQNTSNALYIKKITIGNGITVKSPKPVSDFSVTAPVNGERKVTVSFSFPTETIDGAALTDMSALTKVEIARDGNVVATLTENLTGLSSWEDVSDELTFGKHVYSVTPHNTYGPGASVEAEVTVGAGVPANVASMVMVEEDNTGKVNLTWEPVTTDAQGNEILPSAVTYKVIDRQYNVIAQNLTECSLAVQAVEEGTQAFVQFGVYAVTANGESAKMAATAYKPVGKPSVAPWTESFADRTNHSPFGYNYIKGTEPWRFVNAEWGISPQDDDGGFAFYEAYGTYTALVTGKIDLADVYSPALTYYTYNYGTEKRTNAIALEVDCGDGEGFVTVQTDVICEKGPSNQWNKVVVPLDAYQGQTIIVRFNPVNADLAFYTLDNLRISSYVERNLSAGNLTVPSVVDVDKEFEIEFSVINSGENTINRADLQLMRGEELVDSKEIQSIEPGEIRTVTFLQTLGILDGEGASYTGVISCNVDMLDIDNETAPVFANLIAPVVPVVNDLSAVDASGSASLSWSAPNLSTAAPAEITETFDRAESWSQEVSGWKFVDKDNAPMGGIQITTFPVTGLCSWFVADYSWPKFAEIEGSEAWSAHSGNKFIASSYVLRGGQNVQSDDWAISPKLYGGPQAISFWAKSFDGSYLEDFEVLYSSTTTNVDEFVTIGTASLVSTAWTKYRFKLPDGAKYFAIRSRSVNKFFLFIDDASFIPAEGEARALEIKGYNVYRNGVKITEKPVAETSYVDSEAEVDATTSYFITTVYDKGESRPSNEVSVYVSGVDGVVSASGISITSADGCIKVTGAGGIISVVSADGKTIASVEAAPVTSIPVQAGFYLVKAGSVTAKVVVR